MNKAMVKKSGEDDAESSGNIPFKNELISLADDGTVTKPAKFSLRIESVKT